MADGSIKIDTKIDDSGLKKGLVNLKSSLKKFSSIAKASMVAIGAAIGAAGLALNKFAKNTDRIDKLSQKIGISKQSFQELDFILSQSGTSIEQLQMGMKTFRDEIDNNIETFDALGVSVKNADGSIRNQEDLLFESIAALQKMEDGVEKATIANDLFGRSSTELMPLLNGQAGSIEELKKQANDLGLVLGDDTVNAGVQLTDAMDALKRTFSALFNNAIAPFIPAVLEMIRGFTDWLKEGDRLKNIIKLVGEVVGKLWQQLQPLISFVGKIISGFANWIVQGDNLKKVFNALIYILPTTVLLIKALNLAIASNPVGAIAMAITAVLVPAIIWLVKNWDAVVIVFETKLAQLKQGFRLFASILQESWTVSIAKVKMVFLSLAALILGKVLGAVGKLLDVMGKMPFVGEKFKKASDYIKTLNGNLQKSIETSKKESKNAIELAKKKQDAIEREALNEIKALEKKQKKRLDDFKKQQKANDKEIQATKDKMDKINDIENGKSTDGISAGEFGLGAWLFDKGIDELKEGSPEYLKAVEIFGQDVVKAWNLGEFEGGLEKYLEDKGIDKLKEGSEEYKKLAGAYGKDVTGDFIKGQGEGLEEEEPDLWAKFKKFGKNFAKVMQKIMQVALKVVKGFITAFKNTFNAIKDGIQFIADFDPVEILDNFKTLIDGIQNFFQLDIGNMPTLFQKGVDYFNEFLDGMMTALPSIVDSIGNMVETIISIVDENKEAWGKKIGEFIEKVSIVVLKNIPAIIEMFGNLFIGMLNTAKNTLPQILPVLKDAFVSVLQTIATVLPEILDIMSTVVSDVVDYLLSDNKIVKAFIDIIANVLDVIFKQSPRVVGLFLKLIAQIVTSILSNIDTIITTFTTLILSIIAEIIKVLPDIIKTFISVVPDIIEAIIKMIPDMTTAFISIINSIIDFLVDGLPDIISTFMEVMPKIADALLDNLDIIIDAVMDIINAVIIAIVRSLPTIVTSVIELIPMIVQAFILATPQILLAIFTIVKEMVLGFGRGFAEFAESFRMMGVNILDGIIKGITDGSLWDSVVKVFEDFVDSFKEFFGIHSPSTLFSDFGGYMIDGLVNGVGDIWDKLSGAFEKFGDSVGDFFSDLWDDAMDGFDKLKDKVEEAEDWVGEQKNPFTGNTNKEDHNWRVSEFEKFTDNAKKSWDDAGKKVKDFFKIGFASGGVVPGDPSQGDVVPAMLTPGEIVLNKGHQSNMMKLLSGSGGQSIMRGVKSGISSPSISGGLSSQQNITLQNNMTGDVKMDGRAVAKVVFQNIDRFANGAWGNQRRRTV